MNSAVRRVSGWVVPDSRATHRTPPGQVRRQVSTPGGDGQHDELVREKGPADDPFVAVREVECRHRGAGPETVKDRLLHLADRPCVRMPLQVAPDLVAVVADARGLPGGGGVQQQARRFDRACGAHDNIRFCGVPCSRAVDVADSGDLAARGALQRLGDHRASNSYR